MAIKIKYCLKIFYYYKTTFLIILIIQFCFPCFSTKNKIMFFSLELSKILFKLWKGGNFLNSPPRGSVIAAFLWTSASSFCRFIAPEHSYYSILIHLPECWFFCLQFGIQSLKFSTFHVFVIFSFIFQTFLYNMGNSL